MPLQRIKVKIQGEVQGFWNPDKEDIKAAEARIVFDIEQAANKDLSVRLHVLKYNRHYGRNI